MTNRCTIEAKDVTPDAINVFVTKYLVTKNDLTELQAAQKELDQKLQEDYLCVKELISSTPEKTSSGKRISLVRKKNGEVVLQISVIENTIVIPEIAVVYAISYTEYERGWGCRPDGYSLHKSEQNALNFVNKYYGNRTGPVPDEYSSPDGAPFLMEVSPSLYLAVQLKGDVTLYMNDKAAYKTYNAEALLNT